jgi:hypothetical protein
VGKIAVQLLAASFTSDCGNPTSTILSSSCTVHEFQHAKELNSSLIASLSLHTYQAGLFGCGHYARRASTVSELAAETPRTSSSDVWADSPGGTKLLDGQADDEVSTSTAYRRRSWTQICDSRDHGDFRFIAIPRQPSERRFRSIEESIPTNQTRAQRYVQPMREHVVQRWKRFRRKPRSDSPTSNVSGSVSLRLPGSGHGSRMQRTSDTELVRNDNAGPVRMLKRRPEAHRTRSAPAGSQQPLSRLHGGYPSIGPRSVLLVTRHNTLNDDEADTPLNKSISGSGDSYFTIGARRPEQLTHTQSSSAQLQRVSTAGTTIFTPPIIAEARPNSEKLDYSESPDSSSSGSPGGGEGRMSFL